jgi:hypothetical protein
MPDPTIICQSENLGGSPMISFPHTDQALKADPALFMLIEALSGVAPEALAGFQALSKQHQHLAIATLMERSTDLDAWATYCSCE